MVATMSITTLSAREFNQDASTVTSRPPEVVEGYEQ